MSERAFVAVRKERARQELKWGQQDRPPVEWLAILSEEFGEFAEVVNDLTFDKGKRMGPDDLMTEAIHVAAVAVQIIEWIGREYPDARA